ncbi:hypothetical protein V5F53_11260 [Xanthobacter sp. V4C-4]|uniref:hypothetical protein n=1 Tax=Xanthobacter cornucopiae TaxID=3119924 RepID=UPI00372C31E3
MQLKFPTPDQRETFLASLAKQAPNLFKVATPSYSQPTVVTITPPTPQDAASLKSLVAEDGTIKLYGDVVFKPLKFG